MLDCPYIPGATLCLSYRPDNPGGDPVPTCRMTVEIEKPLLPFTSSQALLVRATNSPPAGLPVRFVLKLQDRRFRHTFNWNTPYDPSLESTIRKGIYGLLHHEDARPNPFPDLGGDDEFPTYQELPWMHHYSDWRGGRFVHQSEVDAYRRLRDFQGTCIPRMFGTVRYHLRQPNDILDPPGFTHPALDTVDGFALEYIEGSNLAQFKVGENISEADADRVAHATFAILRRLRDQRVCHNDLRLQNVLVRHNDFDHPVIIDWAKTIIKAPEEDDEEWDYCLPYAQVDHMRRVMAHGGFHMPSPYRVFCQEEDASDGYSFMLASARPEWRDRLFEQVPITTSDSQVKVVWKPRPGIRYAPDSDTHRI
ncbi:hypothetical protein ONZ45_g17732 [Pleurotus djamor]|nr:hypothetical protein ONZ45_g17732 [Pleurotus djamor]